LAAFLVSSCALVASGCGGESGHPDGGDGGIDAATDSGAAEVDTTRSAFGVFASFTGEFPAYERAAGLTHPEYLEWAGEQHTALGARWTRSNLQLIWDIVEPTVGGGYEWSNRMGTEETFSAAADAGVHYLAVFHEGGILDGELRDPLEQTEEYQRFVRDVVERYDGDGIDDAPGGVVIKHWQVGNETMRLTDLTDGADRYLAWFTATAEAVRESDPDAKMVLIASTDSARVDDLHGQVIPQLAADAVRIDAVDIHHWGSAENIEMRSASEYQALFASLGLEGVELWSTEHGTHVGEVTAAEPTCEPACPSEQVCVQIGPMARCVPRCTADDACPAMVPLCDLDSGRCHEPVQSTTDQARSLVQRYVVNRDLGFDLIMWNNLVSWHEFGGNFGGVYDRMGLVSGGFLEFETDADRSQPRPSWFAFRELAAKTDELWAERLGPVDLPSSEVYASAYRSRQTGVVGWVVWSHGGAVTIERDVPGAGASITSFVTDGGGTPTRDETVSASGRGIVSFIVDGDPLWVEPLP